MGRASRTKETLPDFREWCRATRHPLLFCELTVCQRTPENEVSQLKCKKGRKKNIFSNKKVHKNIAIMW